MTSRLVFAANRWRRTAAALLRARLGERGATAVEYGLMVAFIALAIIVAVTAFGIKVSALFVVPAGAL